jgi:hypothetical protein
MIPALALKIVVIDRIEDRMKAKPTAHVSSATALHKWMETSSAGSFRTLMEAVMAARFNRLQAGG